MHEGLTQWHVCRRREGIVTQVDAGELDSCLALCGAK